MSSTPNSQPPYKELHIYYINGRIAWDAAVNDPHFIGAWEEDGDSFLFFTHPAHKDIQTLLERHPHLILADSFQMTYDEWQGGAIETIQVGRLQVVAPWQAQNAPWCADRILLDPGVVFGTGTHPTTRDCLNALQLAFDGRRIHTVVDLGTGTGLLALAAAQLGANRVLAIDLNRLAAQTAHRNVQLNRMAHQVLVVQGNAKNFMDLSCDLMVSNIHYAVMRQLVATPGFVDRKQFILSGLLRSQARDIEYQLQQRPVKILRKWERDGVWTTFYGRSD